MTDPPQPSRVDQPPSEDELNFIGGHLDDVRRAVEGRTILYTWLMIGFTLGLIAHVAGYFIGGATSNSVVGLLTELLRSLGTALWTGCLLVLFVQVWPEAQQRAARRRMDVYEKALREREPRQEGH